MKKTKAETTGQPTNTFALTVEQMNRDVATFAAGILAPHLAEMHEATMRSALQLGETFRKALDAVTYPAVDIQAAREALRRQAEDTLRLAQAAVPFVIEAMRVAEETQRALSAWYDDLSEDEREEIRRAIESAPLQSVDVNATEAGEM